MFIDDAKQIPEIARQTGFSIFVGNFAPSEFKKYPTFTLQPDEKTHKISVEMVRSFFSTTTKQQSDVFYIVISPESMNEEAENAILKNLEEPREHYHYVFLTRRPSALLTTILSRANIYYEKPDHYLESPVDADEKLKTIAKKLLTASGRDLTALAKEISDKKDRSYALEIVDIAIELAEKSYFKTRNTTFLKKLENLLILHDNITMNGHIKLHFVADMI